MHYRSSDRLQHYAKDSVSNDATERLYLNEYGKSTRSVKRPKQLKKSSNTKQVTVAFRGANLKVFMILLVSNWSVILTRSNHQANNAAVFTVARSTKVNFVADKTLGSYEAHYEFHSVKRGKPFPQ